MAQSVRGHQLRARPCTGNGRAAFPAHFLVLPVVDHQRGRHRAGAPDGRDVEGRPWHAQPALAVALHTGQYAGANAELPGQCRSGSVQCRLAGRSSRQPADASLRARPAPGRRCRANAQSPRGSGRRATPWPTANVTFPQQKSGSRRAHPRRSRRAITRQRRSRAFQPPAAAQPAAATGRHGHPSRGPARRPARCCPIDKRAHAGSLPGRSRAPSPRVHGQAVRGQRYPGRCHGADGTTHARARAPRRPDKAARPIASQGAPSVSAPWFSALPGGSWWMSKSLASRRSPPAKSSGIPGRVIGVG